MISIGVNSAADERHRTAAVHVLDHDDLNVCGEDVAVDFILRLRPSMHFPSIDRQVKQIQKDAADARQLLIAELSTALEPEP